MEVLEIYSSALSEYRAGNYERALEILAEVKKNAPAWKKAMLLEAYIRRAQNFYLSEISVLKNFLSQPDVLAEKNLAADAFSLLGAACRVVGMSDKAVDFFIGSAHLEEKIEKACPEISNAIFAANDVENFTAENFSKLYAEYRARLKEITPYPKKFYSHDKIRVGYLSADFHEHPVTFFAWALLTAYDKNSFAVYCYSSGEKNDAVTEKIKHSVDEWRDISNLTDEDAAKMIRADEIDILFDLSGHTNGNRLLVAARRPAAVQISGIGYMNSTGLDCFDYFLSDETCAGNFQAMQKFFTEKIIRLPRSHFCYTPLKNFPAPKNTPCLEKNYVTFGCFNNFSKITAPILNLWREILKAVPNSRLILKHKIFDNVEGKKFVAEKLRSFGFEISRVELRGFSQNYLEEYGEIDIALDTFPYTGGVTTCEALYMGVPVVSLRGDRHGTRFGYSILKNVGIEELAAKTPQEYFERAIALANDRDLLDVLHKNLRQMMKNSPLMDSRGYVRDIEEKYFKIFQAEKNNE